MRRITVNDFDLSTIDENDPDTEYIYNEVFSERIYDFKQISLPNTRSAGRSRRRSDRK